MRYSDVQGFFYITHISNLPSILEYGILSHNNVDKNQFQHTQIYNTEVVKSRSDVKTSDRKSLWDYANVYFNPRNPMQYRVAHEYYWEDLAIVGISKNILNIDGVFIANGNAASKSTLTLKFPQGLKYVNHGIIKSDWWAKSDDSFRKIMAECLVPDRILPNYIKTINVANFNTKIRVERLIKKFEIPIVVVPRFFFSNDMVTEITPTLTINRGDMFFSKLQTLTISVNIVGIMGKGLASRAKWQFPDIYVYYEKLCRERKMKTGQPILIRRETSLSDELSADPESIQEKEQHTWFLLFPTKDHWKNNSRIEYISDGLDWVRDHYKEWGMESLALPALGCGLGNLDWREVGPLMCQKLKDLQIRIQIYLPTEHEVPVDFLTKEYLLNYHR